MNEQTKKIDPDLEIKLLITVGEGNLIMQALQELPYKYSAAIVQKLQMQATAQINAELEPEETEE